MQHAEVGGVMHVTLWDLVCGDLVRACVQGPSACMCAGTWCVRAWGPGAWGPGAWGPGASVRRDLLQACMCGDLVRACVRGDPVRAW